jgi:hypothetical protein
MDKKVDTVVHTLYNTLYGNKDIVFSKDIKESNYHYTVGVKVNLDAVVTGLRRLEKLQIDIENIGERLNRCADYVKLDKRIIYTIEGIVEGSDEIIGNMILEDIKNLYYSFDLPVSLIGVTFEDATRDYVNLIFRVKVLDNEKNVTAKDVNSKFGLTRFHNDLGTLKNIKHLRLMANDELYINIEFE